MNEGRIWLYVKPTVGIPLFFIGFVLAALLVHAAILTNTTWFGAYWQGGAAKAVASAPSSTAVASAAATSSAS
jgi:light-harvesting protein B-800-850 alpha chain